MLLSRAPVVLTPEQQAAKDRILDFVDGAEPDRQYLIMQGLAGTGKTQILSQVARERGSTLLCTLTGKAASVLHRKTGISAATVHSVFYRLREEVVRNGRRELLWDEQHQSGDLKGFVMLLDEVSMIDETIARDILKTGIRVVASGDPGQLPPVKGEAFFAVPDIRLREVHRQALDSPIIRQAHAVRAGQQYCPDGADFQVTRYLDRDQLLSADTIICWKNDTRHDLNLLMRGIKGLEGQTPQSGETVMCLRNNPNYGIYNGATYTLTRPYSAFSHELWLDLDGVEACIENACFEGLDHLAKLGDRRATPFCFGYAITCHKSQGSEWNSTIVVDEYSRRDERERWIYTAITRAAERCLVLDRLS